jgi:hypothetical protein
MKKRKGHLTNYIRKWANRNGHFTITLESEQTVRDIAESFSEVTKPQGTSHNYAGKWTYRKGHRLITLGSEATTKDISQITFESEQTARDISQYARNWINCTGHHRIKLGSGETARDISQLRSKMSKPQGTSRNAARKENAPPSPVRLLEKIRWFEKLVGGDDFSRHRILQRQLICLIHVRG